MYFLIINCRAQFHQVTLLVNTFIVGPEIKHL